MPIGLEHLLVHGDPPVGGRTVRVPTLRTYESAAAGALAGCVQLASGYVVSPPLTIATATGRHATSHRGVFPQSLGACAVPTNLITDPAFNAYLPAAAVNLGTGTNLGSPQLSPVWLSYWSDSLSSNLPKLQMNMAQVISGSFSNFPLAGVTEVPCWTTLTANGVTQGLWGDYDSLTIANAASFPSLLRYLTDSTNFTCAAPNSIPQNISVTLGDGTL